MQNDSFGFDPPRERLPRRPTCSRCGDEIAEDWFLLFDDGTTLCQDCIYSNKVRMSEYYEMEAD